MAAGATVGESQLQRIIRDLHEAVAELSKEYREIGEPITDDSTNLHKFSYKLEYLLQFDQKEKTTFLGTRKDYWDYFYDCLAKVKGANDGIRFVKSITELKTSLGRGRAFIRYSLVHQRLADTLQQCLMNQKVTSDWFYARSPFLKPHLSADIINHLYELTEVQFDVASRGHDLDASWPTFARRTLGSANSPGHIWKPPSRSSSINSLASSYSQQAHEFSSSLDHGQSLLNDFNESLPACMEDSSTVDDLRLELDQSELKQRELVEKMQQFGEEAAELRGVTEELQRQLDMSLTAQEERHGELRALQERNEALSREVGELRIQEKGWDAQRVSLHEKVSAAEGKNLELMGKLDAILDEKGQQAASHFDSAQKIHELLNTLKEAEKGKMEAVTEMEEKKTLVKRLEEELRIRETLTKDIEAKLEATVKTTSEESAKLEAKVAQKSNELETLQSDLTLKENETYNLHKQLQDLQNILKVKEINIEEVTRKAESDANLLQKKVNDLKESSRTKAAALARQLEEKEAELRDTDKKLQQLEDTNQVLGAERDKLTTTLAESEAKLKAEVREREESRTQYDALMDLKEKLLKNVSDKEEQLIEMTQNMQALESELVASRAFEKQLKGQLDDTRTTVDEKESRLREENRKQDEKLQKAAIAAKLSETATKKLEEENMNLREKKDSLQAALTQIQEELKDVKRCNKEMEEKLAAALKSEADLQEMLLAKGAQLEMKERDFAKLESVFEELQSKQKELELAKANAEATCARQVETIERVTSEKQAMEKLQLEKSVAHAEDCQTVAAKLSKAEKDLQVSMEEVSRVQAEVLQFEEQVQKSEEEKVKSQAQLDVALAQRDELRVLTEQLKSHTEAQNQKHISELLELKKKEKGLMEQHDAEVAARVELTIAVAAMREELSTLKAENSRLALECNETREGLHRANTEMAELGMTICKLSAEKEEAREHWAADTAKIEELQKVQEEHERRIEELRSENTSLQEELAEKEKLPDTIAELQEQLEKTRNQAQAFRDSCREEVEAVRFQMSSENMSYQLHTKSVKKQLEKMESRLLQEENHLSTVNAQLSELEAINEENVQSIAKKNAHIEKTEALLQKSDIEVERLKTALKSAEDALLAAQQLCDDLKQKLETIEADKQNQYLKMTAEIDDLARIKTILEERLIELIKDKDALWQKSDALEFEQKLRSEERWWLVDNEATHCLGCHGQFTWWLRRHHCRLCGRIFCYYCSNNYVSTKQSVKKERCCRDCYMQNTVVEERFSQAEPGPSDVPPTPPRTEAEPDPEPASCKATPHGADSSDRSDDGAYDIITEEEVNGIYDSDATSQTTGGSLQGDQDQNPSGAAELNTGDVNPDEEQVSAVQDSEINLLKSGEVTMAVPLSIEDISQFGDGSRELIIKSCSYSVVTVAVSDCGPTISWVFSSEPKSISFSMVYRESSDTQVEQSKVLIPLTRCNSHKETIQGQLKVRLPGLYTLIFDNSFSRFISKKVFYHLTMEKPVIYDGSDGP